MLTILVVCTGNICRSPIAHGMLADRSERLLDGVIKVSSAGTWAQSGREPMPEAIGAARQHGIDIRDLRSARVTRDLVERSDLVLTMTSEQRAEVVDLDPDALGKTFTLKELVRLLGDLPAAGAPMDRESTLARIRAAHELRQSAPRDWRSVDDEIIDPLGLSMAAYQAVAWEIESATDAMFDLLFGVKTGEPAAVRRGEK